MSRRQLSVGVALVLAFAAGAGSAHAQEAAPAAAPSLADDENLGNQELGAHLGLALGGRVSPGGLHIGGRYLYRLSDQDWFDGGIGFTIGGGRASCFRDRDDSVVCDHGTLDGVGADLSIGVRRFLPGREEFRPYVHGGVALRLASYGDDELRGIAVPLWVGGGVRATVHDGVSVGGGAVLSAGPGWFNQNLGVEPQFSLLVSAGVEFRID